VDNQAPAPTDGEPLARASDGPPKQSGPPTTQGVGLNNQTVDPSLDLILENAGHLLNYAIEAGIELAPGIVQPIIAAKRIGAPIWSGADGGVVVAAITSLAAKLHPVTAETLRACREEARAYIATYRRVVFWLAGFILPLSVLSFVSTTISNSITTDLNAANNLAVTLHAQLDPSAASNGDPTSGDRTAPASVLSDLQQFAALMRAIYSRSEELRWLAIHVRWKPFDSQQPEVETCVTARDNQLAAQAGPGQLDNSIRPYVLMQLPADLKSNRDVQCVVNVLTKIYQDVRLYANNLQDGTAMVWGALSVSVLPVLYAFLGASAYLLRSFSKQIENRTFASSYATLARFVVAGIGGLVVSLFNGVTFGASLSPLAAAFLVGYAADIFFSFLEGLMHNLKGGTAK